MHCTPHSRPSWKDRCLWKNDLQLIKPPQNTPKMCIGGRLYGTRCCREEVDWRSTAGRYKPKPNWNHYYREEEKLKVQLPLTGVCWCFLCGVQVMCFHLCIFGVGRLFRGYGFLALWSVYIFLWHMCVQVTYRPVTSASFNFMFRWSENIEKNRREWRKAS